MDFGTTVIGIIIILLCLFPFVLLSYSNAKKRKKKVQVLVDFVKTKNYKITQNDIWNEYIIAIDEENQILFFSMDSSALESYLMISLKEVNKCNLIKHKSNSNLERLGLELEFYDKIRPNLYLEFYNSELSTGVINEYELQLKWHTIISNTINNP